MGFNRRKLKDQRRDAAEKESANRRARIAPIRTLGKREGGGACCAIRGEGPGLLQDCGLVPKRNTEFFDQAGTEAWAMSRA
jgi:hypothetical protein